MQHFGTGKTLLHLFWGSWLALGVIAFMVLVPVAAASKTGQPDRQPVQGQQICPPAQPGGLSACKLTIDCPPLKSPGQTTCKVTIDCPPAAPAKTDKGKKPQ